LQEARALLGRLEYQRGNVEAALLVFDGIDISAIAPKIKISISNKAATGGLPPMSIHAVVYLLKQYFSKQEHYMTFGGFKVCLSIYLTK